MGLLPRDTSTEVLAKAHLPGQCHGHPRQCPHGEALAPAAPQYQADLSQG